jgi:hypothetical protein
MNAATAAGILGGEVRGTYVSSSKTNEDGSCQFVRSQSGLRGGLLIDVETMTDPASQFRGYLAKCEGTKTPLPAIGNEAIACTHSEKDGLRVDQVIGRVRDRVFNIKLSTTDHTLTANGLREKLKIAAEQVSGYLF